MKIIATLIIFLAASPTFASIKEAMQATVQLFTYYETTVDDVLVKKQSGGSGVIFKVDKENLYIFTASHVVSEKKNFEIKKDDPKVEFTLKQVKVQFFVDGFSSPRIDAKLHWRSYEVNTYNDLAMISIKKADLRNYTLPKPIPIADKNRTLNFRETIISCGCPNLSWPTLWFGHVAARQESLYTFKFNPPPIGGRSGSAIFNENGTKVLGIIIWKASYPGGSGTAIAPHGIHSLTEKKEDIFFLVP